MIRSRSRISMYHHQNSEPIAQPQEDESLFLVGVIRIVQQQRVLIIDYALTFLERDAVLAKVGSSLRRVPFELDLWHAVMYVRCTYDSR